MATNTLILLYALFTSLASSQSVPGASFFGGNGSPGVAAYQLVDDYEPSLFFNKFNFYSSYDPTYGHVQYVNKSVAIQNGLVSVTNQSTAKIIADTTNKWPRGGPGRPSVRVISDNTYTHGLFILDVLHMPWGCGTWPAYWLLGPSWPSNGEIDIIEGVNTQTLNDVSLHSSPNCSIAGSGQTATLQTTNCDTSVNGNSGCGSQLTNSSTPNNYGNGFNNNGGGVYATEWTSNYFKTWFFPRGTIPDSITNGSPDPGTFGVPAVNHQGSCNIDQHFNNMSIIINIDFCGAWAGQVYSQYPECPQTPNAQSLDSCVDFVGNNPSNFTSAYWDIRSIKVYQMPAGAAASATYSTSLSSVTGAATSNTIPKGMGTSTSVLSSQYTGPLSSVTTPSAASSATPAICPALNNTAYNDNNLQAYNIACGSDYNGGSGGLGAAAIVQTLSFEGCLETCDMTSGCIGVAFVGGNGAGNCYLKGTQGNLVYNGAVNAALRVNGAVPSISSAPINSTTSTSYASMPTQTVPPICPDAGGKPFTDSGGVVYSVACYYDFPGSNIGTPFSFDSIAACLPSCDAMSGCIGVTFDMMQRLCQLKSSFTGTQTSNNYMMAARKNAVLTSKSSSSLSAVMSSTSSIPYGYGGAGGGYGATGNDPGYGNGYGMQPSSTPTTTSSSGVRSSTTSSSPSSTALAGPNTSSISIAQTMTGTTSTKSSTTSIAGLPSLSSSPMTTPIPFVTSTSSTMSAPVVANPSTTQGSLSGTAVSGWPSSGATAITLPAVLSESTSPNSLISSSVSLSSPPGPSSTPASGSPPSTSSTASLLPSYSLESISTQSGSQQASILSTASSTSSTNPIFSPSSVSSGPSTISAQAAAPPCPTTTDGYCSPGSQQQTTCADSSGAIYAVSCGTLYYGDVIDTSNVYARDGLVKRASASDIGACQGLCSRYSTCVAFNYVGRSCALLDRVDGSVSNPNAVAGRLVIAAAVTTSSSSSSDNTMIPTEYGSTDTSTDLSVSVTTTTVSSSSVLADTSSITLLPTSSAAVSQLLTTTTYLSSPATVTLTTTTTQQVPSGGSFVMGQSGSYYVYASSSVNTSGSVTLCYDCGLTPTVVHGPTPTPPQISNLTCPASRVGTTTVYTTSTVTTCGARPTCPASGYVIIHNSMSYPGQQVTTTTGYNGQPLTYTQIPITTSTGGSGGAGSGGSGGSGGYGLSGSYMTATTVTSTNAVSTAFTSQTNEPLCPSADNSIYTDSYGMRYKIHCNTLYSDNTLDTQTQNLLSGCIASCDLYNIKSFYLGTQCFGVSWFSDRNSSNCLLKAGNTNSRQQQNCDSCELLTPSRYNTTSTITVVSVSPSAYTTVIGGSIVVSTYTTTLPASTVTIYTTIYTNGVTTGSPIGYSTIPATTVTSTTTTTVGGTTIITQEPGGYYGGGGANGQPSGPATVTVTASGSHGNGPATVTVTADQNGGSGAGYSDGGEGAGSGPATVYIVSTAVSTYVSNGQTIYSTYGVTTVASTVYLPGTTRTVTTTSVSILVTRSVQYVPTTIITTTTQGITTTIVTSVPVTYTQVVSTGGGSGGSAGNGGTVTVTATPQAGNPGTVTVTASGSGGNAGTVTLTTGRAAGAGGNNGTVTVTQSGAPGTTVYMTMTVTTTVLPSSSSSSFTCRTYATNYLNGLHGRAEPTSEPNMIRGVAMQPVRNGHVKGEKQSIFQRAVIMAEINCMEHAPRNLLTANSDFWFVE